MSAEPGKFLWMILVANFVQLNTAKSLTDSQVEEVTVLIDTADGLAQFTDISKDGTLDLSAPSLLSSLSYDLTIAVGVVPAVLVVIWAALVGGAWYYTSYRKALKDWARDGHGADPANDPRCRIGADGRANWDDCYGPYNAQDSLDMINTLTLCHNRLKDSDTRGRLLPLYAIKGQELASIQRVFSHLDDESRPWFTSEKIEPEVPDRKKEREDPPNGNEMGRKNPKQTEKEMRNAEKYKENGVEKKEKRRKKEAKEESKKAGCENYIMAECDGRDDISETEDSVNSVSIIPLHKVEGQTRIAGIQMQGENLQELPSPKVAISPNSHGDDSVGVTKPPEEEDSDGKAPLHGEVAILPRLVNENVV